MNKKCIVVFSLILMLVMNINVFAMTDIKEETTGNKISAKDIQQVLEAGEVSARNEKSGSAEQKVEFLSVGVKENEMNIQGYVYDESSKGDIKFDLRGEIFLGSEQNVGIESYVAQLQDKNENFEVLYFYIKNDKQKSKYIFDKSLLDKKMYAMYLRDKDGNLYIFEDTLESLKLDIAAVKCSEFADSIDDLLWFSKVLPRNVKSSPSYLPKTATETWQSQLYSDSWTFYGDNFYEAALVQATLMTTDVDNSASSASSKLKLIETLYINGHPNTYGLDTLFTVGLSGYTSSHDIENETILGTNTQATSIYWTGSYYKDGSVNLNFSAGLGYSVNLAKIINLGVNLNIEPSRRGETNEYTCDPYTRAAGLSMENTDKVYLKEDEQYLAVNINLSKVPDGANNNEDLFTGQTTMTTQWKFDVYHDLDFIEYINDAEVSVNYDVTN